MPLLVLLILAGSGCPTRPLPPAPSPTPSPTPEEEEPAENVEQRSPRILASLELTQQGRLLLESGRPDDAISTLERAVSINPTNGQNYYYLSEAWILKGNMVQAKEFNRLAGMYLEGDPEWLVRVFEQRKYITSRLR
jgi:predicted Zn-dependent protease